MDTTDTPTPIKRTARAKKVSLDATESNTSQPTPSTKTAQPDHYLLAGWIWLG